MITTKGDSAVSKHYFSATDKHFLQNKKACMSPTTAILPNKDTITATLEGNIPPPTFSDNITNTKIFSYLNHSLISLGQLYDDNCIVTLIIKI